MSKYQEALNEMYAALNDSEKWIDKKKLLQELVDKETPVKPFRNNLLSLPPRNMIGCGKCNGLEILGVYEYCPYCGQKIDWIIKDE